MKITYLKSLLSQPYPYYYHGRKFVKYLIFIFLFAFCFNYFFQPFHTNYLGNMMNYFWISIFRSFSPIFILLILTSLLNVFLKNQEQKLDNWNIKKEFTIFILLFFLTGIAQFFIQGIINNNFNYWCWKYLIKVALIIVTGGIILAFMIILFNHYRLKSKTANKILSIKIHQKDAARPISINEAIFIITELKSEDFTFDVKGFLYAKSEGNYMEIYFIINNETVKMIKRLTLKSLGNQLANYKFIIKTHRSIILNLNLIEKISGNSQGYKIKLKNYPIIIPVSRSFIAEFENALQTI